MNLMFCTICAVKYNYVSFYDNAYVKTLPV